VAIKRDDFPLPDAAEPLTAPFFAGAARGELVIPRCAASATTCGIRRSRARATVVRSRGLRCQGENAVHLGGRAPRVPARVRRPLPFVTALVVLD